MRDGYAFGARTPWTAETEGISAALLLLAELGL
jgi:hypothetical protein